MKGREANLFTSENTDHDQIRPRGRSGVTRENGRAVLYAYFTPVKESRIGRLTRWMRPDAEILPFSVSTPKQEMAQLDNAEIVHFVPRNSATETPEDVQDAEIIIHPRNFDAWTDPKNFPETYQQPNLDGPYEAQIFSFPTEQHPVVERTVEHTAKASLAFIAHRRVRPPRSA